MLLQVLLTRYRQITNFDVLLKVCLWIDAWSANRDIFTIGFLNIHVRVCWDTLACWVVWWHFNVVCYGRRFECVNVMRFPWKAGLRLRIDQSTTAVDLRKLCFFLLITRWKEPTQFVWNQIRQVQVKLIWHVGLFGLFETLVRWLRCFRILFQSAIGIVTSKKSFFPFRQGNCGYWLVVLTFINLVDCYMNFRWLTTVPLLRKWAQFRTHITKLCIFLPSMKK